jgi:predicted transporter
MGNSRNKATVNVTSILMGALIFGLAAGLPVGYFAHQLYGASPNPNLATLQRE